MDKVQIIKNMVDNTINHITTKQNPFMQDTIIACDINVYTILYRLSEKFNELNDNQKNAVEKLYEAIRRH